MTLCGLHPDLNTSEKQALPQDFGVTHNISKDFPFLNVENLETHILGSFTVLFSMFGMVGNGLVLWFFCFCLKGNTFIFVTNLAVADFGVSFVTFIFYSLFFIAYLYGHSHYVVCIMNLCLASLFLVMFCASALFLAAVSADRCVAVFFPLWHRCHRPESLPSVVSALLWPLAFIAGGVLFYYTIWTDDLSAQMGLFSLFDSFIVISISTLLIRVCCYSHVWQKGRLHTIVLLALSIFIITLIPQNFLFLFMKDMKQAYLINDFLTCVNSSANPVIYFFIGRLRSGPSRRSIKAMLKKIFNEEEDYEGQPSSSKTSFQTT